ncbi:MAG: phospholipase D family protein, partial [Gammaproteobacteria bacterium]|nr:phospholipase D family protein [Gammaproteobacteria bacterium]
GSMNYDSRSAQINTEMGVFIESTGLAQDLAELIERDIRPANSWQVTLDDKKQLRWTADKETVTRQPARSWWQRVQDVIFMVFPVEYY